MSESDQSRSRYRPIHMHRGDALEVRMAFVANGFALGVGFAHLMDSKMVTGILLAFVGTTGTLLGLFRRR